jgi:hypothetical protein
LLIPHQHISTFANYLITFFGTNFYVFHHKQIMARNPGKNSGGQEKQNVTHGKGSEHASAPTSKRSKSGDNPTERERNAGKTGGARRGISRRTGSDHDKG